MREAPWRGFWGKGSQVRATGREECPEEAVLGQTQFFQDPLIHSPSSQANNHLLRCIRGSIFFGLRLLPGISDLSAFIAAYPLVILNIHKVINRIMTVHTATIPHTCPMKPCLQLQHDL
jgi:hypothetical protein